MTAYTLANATQYAICVSTPNAFPDYIIWKKSLGTLADGQACEYRGSWAALSGDMCFETYGSGGWKPVLGTKIMFGAGGSDAIYGS
jgi:hypothetical protein